MRNVRFYTINGAAYTEMLMAVTNKTMSQISQELGYSPTYIKNVRAEGKIRVAVANQIESAYGVPVCHYIEKEQPKEEKDSRETITVNVGELTDVIKDAILGYFQKKLEVEK